MRRWRHLVGLSTTVMVVASLSTAMATGSGAQPAPPTAQPPAEVRSVHAVTLVTGDVVHVTRFADGRQSAVLDPAPGTLGGFHATEVNGELYVTPHTAAPYLASGQLDRELFNVSNLIEFGYDDAGRSSLPLIVQYAAGDRAKAPRPVPPGAVRHVELSSVGARGVEQDKAAAASFWEAVDDDRPVTMSELRLADSISKIWLDPPVRATLEESVPQIGAPQAWAAGVDGRGVRVAVLDSGVDPAHPDLAGKIVASRSFVPNEDITDTHGHGTHVAATVAGTGAASGGQRKGVAPGAELIIGKVLGNRGLGNTSWIIAAMEWAAVEQDADVVNLSLGSRGFYSDGSDPASQAVNALTAATGTLFVIAAANDGPNAGTVTSPAAADAALSVGAVDKSDVLASFSSRGPRTGDFAVKPEVTAPGVGIAAARAAGTAMGTPVDDRYTRASGTSMAAPHVAGAAAILAQRNPGWQAEQLKSALVSTATPGEYTPFQQGTGRVDVPRALDQGVYASPSTLAYGLQGWPYEDDPAIDKTITYRNDTASAVTLQLDVDVTDDEGNAAGDGLFRVSPATVTVPPGGSQPVTLTFEAGGDAGVYVGTVTATGTGGTTVRTAFSVAMEPELHTVSVPGITRDGRPANGRSHVELFNLDTGGECTAIIICHTVYYATYQNGTPSFRVPPGRYSLMAYLNTNDAPNTHPIEVTLTGYPTLNVDRDMTVTLDARDAVEVVVETPKVAEAQGPTLNYYRAIGPNRIGSFGGEVTAKRLFVKPTGPVTDGEFEFNTKWRLYAPAIQGEVVRPERLPLDLQYMTGAVPKLDGVRRLPVVYVGAARPEDFTGRDVRGKIALVQRTAAFTFQAQAANAAAAGAAAVVIHNNTPGLFMGEVGSAAIPVFSLSYDEGRQLVELLQRGPVTVRLHGIPASPYKFDVIYATQGEIPAEPRYRVTRQNSARVTMDYHDPSHGGGTLGQCGQGAVSTNVPSCVDELREGNVHSAGLTITSFVRLLTPRQREEWISGDGTWWRQWLVPILPLDEIWVEPIRQYSGGQQLHESWFKSVLRPAPVNDNGARRTGDQMHFRIAGIAGAHPHRAGTPITDRFNPIPVARLYRNGQLVGERTGSMTPGLWQTDFTTTPERADYRLTLDTAKPYWWGYSTTTNTVWTFRSQRTEQTEHLPLMHAFYDMDLDLTNRAAANAAFAFGVRLGRGPDHTQTAMREVKVWASFNDGGTWRRATVAGNNGTYTVVVDHPRLANTTGYVSLRIRAVDADGNTVDQTVIRAYGLK